MYFYKFPAAKCAFMRYPKRFFGCRNYFQHICEHYGVTHFRIHHAKLFIEHYEAFLGTKGVPLEKRRTRAQARKF